jgi:hypothetical protein
MSGGIFEGYPFTLNIKCIIFSLIIMALYSFCPPHIESKLAIGFIYFLIFVISYVSLAWYDYYYGCSQLPLMRGKHSFTGLFKPPPHQPKKQLEHLISETEYEKNKTLIYLLHLLVIVPLLVYIGVKGSKTHPRAFEILLVLAAMTVLYHGGKLIATSHTSRAAEADNAK